MLWMNTCICSMVGGTAILAAGRNKRMSFASELEANGYAHIPRRTKAQLREILRRLGSVIYETDVKIKPESKALVTSARALDFHTDHRKAKWVVWHCVEQTDDGGESILVDAEKIYAQLSVRERAALAKIMLFEHKIFDDDEECRPLVERRNGKRIFYYSFWLARRDLPAGQKAALNSFRAAIEREEPATIKLQKGDVLIADNHRILHGRRIIRGSQNRFLKRFWLSETTA